MGTTKDELQRLADGMAGTAQEQAKRFDGQTTAAAALITAAGTLFGVVVQFANHDAAAIASAVLAVAAIVAFLLPAGQLPSLLEPDLDLLVHLYALLPEGLADLWLARTRALGAGWNEDRLRIRRAALAIGTLGFAAALLCAAVSFGFKLSS